jgi:hypothetical protein
MSFKFQEFIKSVYIYIYWVLTYGKHAEFYWIHNNEYCILFLQSYDGVPLLFLFYFFHKCKAGEFIEIEKCSGGSRAPRVWGVPKRGCPYCLCFKGIEAKAQRLYLESQGCLYFQRKEGKRVGGTLENRHWLGTVVGQRVDEEEVVRSLTQKHQDDCYVPAKGGVFCIRLHGGRMAEQPATGPSPASFSMLLLFLWC